MTHRRITFAHRSLTDDDSVTALKAQVDAIKVDLDTLDGLSESARETAAERGRILDAFEEIARIA